MSETKLLAQIAQAKKRASMETAAAMAVAGGAVARLDDTSTLRSDLALAAGTYTPTLTNVLNLSASSAQVCFWSRNGDVVTVSGVVNVDPVAAGATVLALTLPLASSFLTTYQCAGVAASAGVAGLVAAITADAVNDRALLSWVAVDVAAQDLSFTFQYRII